MKGGIRFLLLLGLGLATGCGGSDDASTTGDPGGGGGSGAGANGGAGGGGNTGSGAGNTTGNGGSGAGTTTGAGGGGGEQGCSFEKEIGFDYKQFGSSTGTVTSVAPEELIVDTGDSVKWTLAWAGSDLTTLFSPGQAVQVEVTGEGWDSVATDTDFVAAFFRQTFGNPNPPGPPPGSEITLDRGSGCPSGGGVYYDVLATVGEEMITVEPGKMGTVGKFEVFNAGTQSSSGNGEQYFFDAVTVRGPVSPP